MRIFMGGAAFVPLCFALLSGCALLSPVTTDTTKYVLNPIPPNLPSEQLHSASVLVLVPETDPVYATTQMAYSTKTYEIAYFSQNEWGATLSQMIQPLIVETLRNTNYFSEVLPSPHFGHHTFALRTEILDLKQDFTSEPATLQLAMRFYLSRESTSQVIATKEITLREPMREKTPYAGVVAANEAMGTLLRELANFVTEKAR